MAIKKSIELVDKKVICLKEYTYEHDLVCSDCQQKYKYEIPPIVKLRDITFCPFCGKEREITIKEVKTNISGVLAIILGGVSGIYKDIDIIKDVKSQVFSNCVTRNTYQISISIEELNSMMEIYGLTRIGDMWVDLNFLDKAIISTKDDYGGVLNFIRDIHFSGGRNFIFINNKKVFNDLIENKIYLKADLSRTSVEFYEKYYKPYEETMKEKYPEIVLLKLMNEDF